ncbi:MAG: CBS domain-containing protein [Desulfobacteraceae bacterium]|nr:CBS domain-containing protein [Desulfobacteraceae bacterium]MDH3575680.1 CBS domain-containing protein [Desulfobacteraceae bacterium]
MQVVTTHKNTDFDAMASTIAASILYPEAVPVLPKQVNPNVKAFLSIHKDIFKTSSFDDIPLDDVKRLIVVDINSWGRLGRIRGLKKSKNLEILLWDHHSNVGDIKPTWKCQEPVGANITLMVRQLKQEKKILTPIQATLFLAGLYEDTGNLTFPASTAEDAYAAAYLLERKADLNIIGSFLRPAYGEKQKNVLFEMLRSAKRDKVNGYSVSLNKLNLKDYVDNLAVVVHMYREILNVDAAFGIFMDEERNRCMIIGRSNADGLDIGLIMRSMGGGGHPAAGSAVLKPVNPDAVEDMIRELIQGNQQASVQISDLMSFPVYTVPPDTSMKKVASMLRKKGCTGFPVVEDGKLVGMISRRDFKKLKKESQLKAPVKAFMKTDVMTIAPGKSPTEAARLMVKHDIGRLPVVENENILGILTRSDTMLYFYDLLPD